jgi:hypothetical protein
MTTSATPPKLRTLADREPTPANRLRLDYVAEAERLGAPPVPIIDAHTHINGARASEIYRDVCDRFGIERIWSMSSLAQVPSVRQALGDRISFIAVPDFRSDDLKHAFTQGYLDQIRAFRDEGAEIVKFWTAPRARDIARELGEPELMDLESPWRQKAMELAADLGMFFMAHIADPDTWFQTKYADASLYGTKREQYEPLERCVERFPAPWILAHMGGWPEDLEFLTGLLERHENLYLDTSATKWMVRELSKHPSEKLLAFLERFSGRILFGSDIVTTDEHLSGDAGPRGMGHLASSEEDAFELYASRYWALRTMWETAYDGESNIADPDLALVDPESHDGMSAPRLRGHRVPRDLLSTLYAGAATALLDGWRRGGAE